MIDFHGGVGAFAGWPRRIRDYANETTAVNVLDWASAYAFAPASLSKIAMPILVVRGENSHPAVQRANELLCKSIPGATIAAVPGAAHFMITTHARELADLIASRFSHAPH
jgi:pimeloyl-ACP methyl ester carboxylesterase